MDTPEIWLLITCGLLLAAWLVSALFAWSRRHLRRHRARMLRSQRGPWQHLAAVERAKRSMATDLHP